MFGLGPTEIVLIIGYLAFIVFWIITLTRIIGNRHLSGAQKVLWFVFVFIFNVFGVALYYFINWGRTK